jgi:C-terminal processing protease CtpA/Prc
MVGERTASVHSDVLEKTLPNGWSVTLSNEVFENSDGIVYEAKGVPPAVEAAFFTPSLIAGGPDPGVEAALQLLDRLS